MFLDPVILLPSNETMSELRSLCGFDLIEGARNFFSIRAP